MWTSFTVNRFLGLLGFFTPRRGACGVVRQRSKAWNTRLFVPASGHKFLPVYDVLARVLVVSGEQDLDLVSRLVSLYPAQQFICHSLVHRSGGFVRGIHRVRIPVFCCKSPLLDKQNNPQHFCHSYQRNKARSILGGWFHTNATHSRGRKTERLAMWSGWIWSVPFSSASASPHPCILPAQSFHQN